MSAGNEDSWEYFTERLSDGQCRVMLDALLDTSRRLMLHYRRAAMRTDAENHDRMHCGSMASAHTDLQNYAMSKYERLTNDR